MARHETENYEQGFGFAYEDQDEDAPRKAEFDFLYPGPDSLQYLEVGMMAVRSTDCPTPESLSSFEDRQ